MRVAVALLAWSLGSIPATVLAVTLLARRPRSVPAPRSAPVAHPSLARRAAA